MSEQRIEYLGNDEFKLYVNGVLRSHGFQDEDEYCHGEVKFYTESGGIWRHVYFVHGMQEIDLLEEPVTDEDKMILALTKGFTIWLK